MLLNLLKKRQNTALKYSGVRSTCFPLKYGVDIVAQNLSSFTLFKFSVKLVSFEGDLHEFMHGGFTHSPIITLILKDDFPYSISFFCCCT